MAITDIKAYAHLSPQDVEDLAAELDAIRADIEESRGERDAQYIRRAIQLQRGLAAFGRLALFASSSRIARLAGIASLASAKIIENMELGHNIIHGQWDWMNDPEIHSTEWEWDTTCPSSQWKHSHNFVHHKYTNVVGLDSDVGYGIMRVTRDEPWEPWMIGNPVYNLLLGTFFQWGVALHHVESAKIRKKEKTWAEARKDLRVMGTKMGKQAGKDYLLYPALAGTSWKHTLKANAVANLIRNYWTYMVNFNAGPIMAFMSGNLCYQIEHHMFPDLPSNRYAEIGVRVRALCEKYDLPYTTGPLLRQYWQSFWTIAKLALPDTWLSRTSDDAPETRSEKKFSGETRPELNGKRYGLRTALKGRSRVAA